METQAYVRKQNTNNNKLQISKISYITSREPDIRVYFLWTSSLRVEWVLDA